MARGDKAISDLDAALTHEPKNRQALLLRGSLYYNEPQLDRSILDLTEAIDQNPGDPTAYQLLAEALLRKGDRKSAIRHANLALEKDPSYIPAHVTIGDIQKSDLIYDKAAESYSRALNLDPNNFEARLKRARLTFEIRKFPEALDYLDTAVKVNPYSGDVYTLRSKCYAALGDQEKARQDSWRAKVFVNR
mgnify:CR=1 FL=1